MASELYLDDKMPISAIWLAFLMLWFSNEAQLARWDANAWNISLAWRKFLHVLRVISPWCMIWPVAHYWLMHWLGASWEPVESGLWFSSGSFSRYLPSWAMMGVLAWVILRAEQAAWPCTPLVSWYQKLILPSGVAWSVWLAVYWNLTKDGTMAPLPYLPLFNPLDLTTIFAILLVRLQLRTSSDLEQRFALAWPQLNQKLLILSLGFVWCNLILLRSIAQYAHISYQFEPMFASQLVQVILSLVWSSTALVLMRYAAQNGLRQHWVLGASLLGLVVAKLAFVDLSNSGGIERIISFVGVGVLMVAIGYLAPPPSSKSSS